MTHHHHHHIHHRVKQSGALKTGPIDYVVNFFMFLSPLFELPQAYDIYTQKSSNTVSLTTWAMFFVASIAWLVYGIRHKLRSIIIIQIVYLIIEASVVVGILIYP
jgi:uncharacterized protein with PQ loop repeat